MNEESERVKHALGAIIQDGRAQFDGLKGQRQQIVAAAAQEFNQQQQQQQQQQRADLNTLGPAMRIEVAQLRG